MRYFDFVAVKLCLCLVLGILIGFYIQPDSKPLFATLLAFLLGLLLWAKSIQKSKDFPFFGVLTLLFTTVLGILISTLSLPKNQPYHFSHFTADTKETFTLKIERVLKPDPYALRYHAKVTSVNEKPTIGTILLSIAHDSTKNTIKVDDELILQAKITDIPPPLNPHQFNYKEYLEKLGIHHQIRTVSNRYVLRKDDSRTFTGKALQLRENIIEKLKTHDFGIEQRAVIQALVLGQRDDITETTYNNYKNAGAVHILAVSGLHVGILLLLLQFLLAPLQQLPKGKTIKLIAIVTLLWGYAFLTGLSPSIIRAVTMFSFLAYALYLNRPTNTFNIVALSMFFILLMKPLILFQVGFQMSYAAVFAIVIIHPKLQRFWYPKFWIVQKSWQLLSVSVAAQLGVLPLSLFYFHQFPALFFVSNLVVVPFLGIIFGMGIMILALAYFEILPQVLVWVYNRLIGAMNLVIAWIAEQESFIFRDISFDGFQLVMGYLFVFALVASLSKGNFKNVALLLSSISAFGGYLIYDVLSCKDQENILLLHQTKNTALFHQNGKTLHVLATDSSKITNMVNNYRVGKRIEKITFESFKRSYGLGRRQLLIVDSLGIYPSCQSPDFVLLMQSPKINLERLLDSLRPKMILADGSNYKSYVERWQRTCRKQKLPFHYTGEKGAYSINITD